MPVDSNAMTSLASAQTYLGLSTGDGYDELLESLINACSASARSYIGYDPYPTDYEEYHDGEGQDMVILRRRPILVVNAVWDDGEDVGDEDDDYFVYPDSGLVKLDNGMTFATQRKGILVEYYAGLSPWPPADLSQAINRWVQSEFASRGTGTTSSANREVKSEKVGDYAVEYEDAGASAATTVRAEDMPSSVQAVLDRYKTVGIKAV